jgi:hypothetical protein
VDGAYPNRLRAERAPKKTPNRKRAIEYLAACGAAAITTIVRDGLGTITTGKTTTGTVAARWWIAERTARAWARRLAGSWRHSDVPSAIAALQRSAASLQATLTPHDIAIYANPLASFVPVKQ